MNGWCQKKYLVRITDLVPKMCLSLKGAIVLFVDADRRGYVLCRCRCMRCKLCASSVRAHCASGLSVFEEHPEPFVQGARRHRHGVARFGHTCHPPRQIFIWIAPIEAWVPIRDGLPFAQVLKKVELGRELPLLQACSLRRGGQRGVDPHELLSDTRKLCPGDRAKKHGL